MNGKAWSRCVFCKEDIFRFQYEQAGQYLIICENGHKEPRWFCNMECWCEMAKQRGLNNKFISIPIKPFGEKHRIKLNIIITATPLKK